MPRKRVSSAGSPYRVAYLISHPIQYQAPLLRYIVAHSEIELTAFFLSDFSVKSYQDEGFGTAVQWDVPLLDGYPSVVLPALGDNQRLTPLRPFVYGLARHLKAGRFDALWLHGYAHQANLRALFVAKSLGMKVFLRTDSQLASCTSHPLKGWLEARLLRRLFRAVDGFLVAGTLNRDYFRHYGAPEAKTFPALVRDGENGYVVPVGDTAALARRLHDVTCDLDKARRMGERSLEIIRGAWRSSRAGASGKM